MEEIKPKQSFLRRHYHWIVFLAVSYSFSIAVGMKNNLYSLFLIPITQDLQISRGVFSLAPGIRYFAAFFSNLLFGALYHKYGYRRTTSLAMLIMAVVFVTYGTAQNVLPFYIGAVVSGLLEPFYATASTSRIVREWFHRHQGTIIGVTMAASGIGTSILSPMLSGIAQRSGWRTSQTVAAGAFFLGAVLIFLLVSDSPKKKGLRPWGEEKAAVSAGPSQETKRQEWHIPNQILRTRPFFWLMVLGAFLSCFIVNGAYSLIPAHVEDQGMTPELASLIQSITFLLLAAYKVLVGTISDWIGARRVTMLCIAACAAGLVVLAVGHTPWMAILGAALFAVPMTIPSVTLPLLTSDVFDGENYSFALGIMLAMVSLGGALAGPAINFSYDVLGSYTPAFLVLSVVAVLTMVVYVFAFRGADREKKRLQAERVS